MIEVRQNMSDDGKEIAATTLQQLGNYGKMKAMIGIHSLVCDPDGTLYFRFKVSRKANECVIHLNGNDLYDMTFYRNGKGKLEYQEGCGTVFMPNRKEVGKFTDLYNDQLTETFESFTGLRLSL